MNYWAIQEYPFYFKHFGFLNCGGVAFYLKRRLCEGDLIEAEDVVWINGKKSKQDEMIVCGNCYQPIKKIDLSASYIMENL